jgi:phage terminase large subunit
MPRAVEIQTADVFLPLLEPARYKGAYGGRSSAKSWFFADNLLDRCICKPSTRAVCIREVQKSLEQSVKRLLEDRIAYHQVGDQFRVLNTHIEAPGDGVVIFQGMQNSTAESIKSLEGFDVAWVEEAQVLSQHSLELLRPTIRKEGSEIWFSWNPRYVTDPVDQFLRVDPPPDAIVVRANYSDNPFLTDVIKAEIRYDRGRDRERFAHVWGGDYEKSSEARVLKHWRVEEFDTPADADFLFGGDWGYSVDPTVAIRGFVKCDQPKTLYIDDEAYRVGCELDYSPFLFDTIGCRKRHAHVVDRIPQGASHEDAARLPDQCEAMARRWVMVCDSARPETIAHMRRHGYPRVEPAVKGPNSVQEGLEFLNSYDTVINPRCTHVIDEFTHYSFKRHPLTQEVMPVLEDKKNHTIDSARYLAEKLRKATAQLAEVW